MVLEIVTGKRNRPTFPHEGYPLNLLGHVWKLNPQGKALELVDSNLNDSSYCSSEVLRAKLANDTFISFPQFHFGTRICAFAQCHHRLCGASRLHSLFRAFLILHKC